MGKRGPKPKPTAVNLLDGNPSRRPLNEDEPQCGHPPIMPASVGADAIASAEWHRLRDVTPPQLYTAMDVSALTQYCLAWSMLLRSQQELDERGLMLTTPHYDKEGNHLYDEVDINPATKTWKAANETLFKCIDRLGLAPSTRTRLQLPKKVDAASKFAGLIGRGN